MIANACHHVRACKWLIPHPQSAICFLEKIHIFFCFASTSYWALAKYNVRSAKRRRDRRRLYALRHAIQLSIPSPSFPTPHLITAPMAPTSVPRSSPSVLLHSCILSLRDNELPTLLAMNFREGALHLLVSRRTSTLTPFRRAS